MTTLVFDGKDRIGAWVAEQVEQTAPWGAFYAMGAVDDAGEIVAGIVMNNYNGSNGTVHIAVKKPGKYLFKLFRHFTHYAFVQAGMKRITGLVPASKPKVLAFDRKLGLQHEFTMKAGAADGGDLHVLVMWADTCPWLKGPGG